MHRYGVSGSSNVALPGDEKRGSVMSFSQWQALLPPTESQLPCSTETASLQQHEQWGAEAFLINETTAAIPFCWQAARHSASGQVQSIRGTAPKTTTPQRASDSSLRDMAGAGFKKIPSSIYIVLPIEGFCQCQTCRRARFLAATSPYRTKR
jgi:hypothetical protein